MEKANMLQNRQILQFMFFFSTLGHVKCEVRQSRDMDWIDSAEAALSYICRIEAS